MCRPVRVKTGSFYSYFKTRPVPRPALLKTDPFTG
ncbi:Versicolorin B synthase [Venturia inaequalis]|nr:Versicolorin B synthase [Venturia inaequalis]